MFRVILDVFYILMIFEGAVRKWAFPELGAVLQIFRDILPVCALAAYALGKGKKTAIFKLPFNIAPFLGAYCAIVLLEIANPSLWSPLVGLLGIRTHLAYIPLLFLMGPYLDDLQSLKRRATAFVVVGIPISLLAAYQTTQPGSSWINRFASGEANNAYFGVSSMMRASGTFAYITGMTVFAQFLTVLSVFVLLAYSKTIYMRALSAAGVCCGLIGGFSSGSRGGVAASALQVLLFVWWQSGGKGRFFRLFASVTVILICVAAVSYVAEDQFNAFLGRANSTSSDTSWRLLNMIVTPIEALDGNILGTGVGMGHQQASVLVGMPASLASGFEDEVTRLAYELGILGLTAFLGVKIGLLLFGVRLLRQIKDYDLRAILALAVSGLPFGLIGGIYVPISNALYWTMGGLTVAVWRWSRIRAFGTVPTKEFTLHSAAQLLTIAEGKRHRGRL